MTKRQRGWAVQVLGGLGVILGALLNRDDSQAASIAILISPLIMMPLLHTIERNSRRPH